MENETKTTPVLMKPEFWMTLVTCVAGLLLTFGVITPEQNEGIAKYAPNLIGAIMSLLSSFKFVNVQHAAKVEVFRAMCATNLEKASKTPAGQVSAQATSSAAQAEVVQLARAAGL